ncbi:hypothetical protein GQ57_31105 [Burkholderia sp. MSh2]|nr:hypothetical protein GQ57_31105 [Burkholderia sp. MSh2]
MGRSSTLTIGLLVAPRGGSRSRITLRRRDRPRETESMSKLPIAATLMSPGDARSFMPAFLETSRSAATC